MDSTAQADRPKRSATLLCERCSDMFSTLEGLRALLDRLEGYFHSTWREVRMQADAGCELCRLTRRSDPELWPDGGQLRFFVRGEYVDGEVGYRRSLPSPRSEYAKYPLEISEMGSVCYVWRWDPEIDDYRPQPRAHYLTPFQDMSEFPTIHRGSRLIFDIAFC
jgi:hypothetical protein